MLLGTEDTKKKKKQATVPPAKELPVQWGELQSEEAS